MVNAWPRHFLVVVACCGTVTPGSAQSISEGGVRVDIVADTNMELTGSHGYFELQFRITSTSDQRHRVALAFPSTSYSHNADQLREARVERIVEPRETVN